MAISLQEFTQDFFQDCVAEADAGGIFKEDAFFFKFCEYLVEAGELETSERVQFVKPQGGIRVDGYGGDPSEANGVLSLVILDFNQKNELSRLTETEMNAIFKRLFNFLKKALNDTFRNGLEETTPAFELADLIAHRWNSVSKVRLFLVSNRQLSDRVDGRKAEELDSRPITHNVWDISRLWRAYTNQGRDEIQIDLEEEFGGAIKLLPAHLPEAQHETYLAVIPGNQLAAIYDNWGTRLLEQNVRVFLQARSNVNRGIKNTILFDPAMFLAYNNGITATAEEITTKNANGNLNLIKIHNFQIVNGGQTTASIHAAYKQKVDLSNVFIQMKLSIVQPSRAVEIVPKISEYANSQNRVNAADFFANHPFHIRMEEFSRRMYVPSMDGTFRQSKWFYERARGQYADARGQLTVAERKKFDLEHPRIQMFTKTDLAKFLNVWQGIPHIVSRGAQKNFADFAQSIGKNWTNSEDQFNEKYYRALIAKAIVFRSTERIVSEQPWYGGGYRANIVAYSISKVASDVEKQSKSVNFEDIWKNQEMSKAMRDAIASVACDINNILVEPPMNMRNVTEWAKQQACWEAVRNLEVKWPPIFIDEWISEEEEKSEEKYARKEQRVLNGIDAQKKVINQGGKFWEELLQWGLENNLTSPKEIDILKLATKIPSRIPTEKQSFVILAALKKFHDEGCPIGRDILT